MKINFHTQTTPCLRNGKNIYPRQTTCGSTRHLLHSLSTKTKQMTSHVNNIRWYPPQPSLRVISIPLSTVSLLGISYFGCQGNYGTWSCTLNVMIVASILLPVQACTHMLDRCWMGGKCPRMWVTGSSFYHYYQQLRLGHESGEIAEMAWFWN